MMDADAQNRLARWLSEALGANSAAIVSLKPLAGGAIQENWLLDLDVSGGVRSGLQRLVIRKDAPASIASSHNRKDEFALLAMAYAGGITVPEPVAFCSDTSVLGGAFAVMSCVDGVGFGPTVVKDAALGGDREALGRRLGAELAKIHALSPAGEAFDFLGAKPARPAAAMVERLRSSLDRMGVIRPEIEWGLRFLETQAPKPARITLCHHDFRTGNYMANAEGLTAILDWEFAGWGDPMADLGWFCAQCWRFSRPDREGGGVTDRASFYAGYEAQSGLKPDHDAVLFWEIAAHLRWAVIALEQGHRHVSGEELSLPMALTGRMAAELTHHALKSTAPDRWRTA
ncbi:MAG: phosphotransferase family protein [Bosea sp. (in: a-proteobacteria)]